MTMTNITDYLQNNNIVVSVQLINVISKILLITYISTFSSLPTSSKKCSMDWGICTGFDFLVIYLRQELRLLRLLSKTTKQDY